MIEGKDQLDQELNTSEDSDAEDHFLSVGVRTQFSLGDNHVNVDADIGEDTVPEDPKWLNGYQLETKNTLSVS